MNFDGASSFSSWAHGASETNSARIFERASNMKETRTRVSYPQSTQRASLEPGHQTLGASPPSFAMHFASGWTLRLKPTGRQGFDPKCNARRPFLAALRISAVARTTTISLTWRRNGWRLIHHPLSPPPPRPPPPPKQTAQTQRAICCCG